ncbi:glutathione ABC transporter substrate-binding protein [Heyndrickxia sporothermodurans]|uniref:glutathione ABC transporter substrate-binding protein n=1 Tax=Heyndrickxia TaxID=2837504 RepID=UPI000D3D709F|nr:glutathione ABC transporter substrate-binding protein [Heyndrickxia sporothermodurans]MBL5768593.1 glutathione ABC transporter substrate-binding protein [Heyndrickxia sporothermodurans]MBL5772268.1 glutathione ABC transporter substrate-binding protein [Heyndrickxia sporothermodurans]MBL5779363.1 glutathione ABC transporter substrate-binding protein [Heyndrickxia sporothermodurans]MBL5782104.1 glutathione ABC transporter substrate-binding protein [Heyndrickxia sporothermodurans]MBL5786461.1 
MRKKGFGIITAIICLSLMLFGCSNSSSSSSGDKGAGKIVKKEGKDITVAVASNFVSLDPHDSNDTLGLSAERMMMEGLVGFDKEMNIVPVLAEKYSINKNATELTFNLRKDVKFQDGTPFNAEAVKVNIDRLSNPDNHLKRYSLFELVKTTNVVDEYTVKVTLKKPFGAMLNNFAHPSSAMISPAALKKYGKDIARHPVGTGPFKFDEWDQSDHLKLVKNEAYWKKGYPKVDSITFKPVPENGSRIAMLQTGEADFAYPIPTEQVKSIDGKNGIVVENDPSIIVYYLSMNTMKKPYDDVRIRQAMNYAINKDAFIKVVWNGYGEPASSIIAPKVGFYSKQEPYTFNLEKAKELMKDAGVEKGFTAKIWLGNSSTSIKAAEFIQQQLAQINVKVDVVPMEAGTLSEKLNSPQKPEDAEVELYFGGWSPSTGDADWGIRPLFGGKDAFPPLNYNTAYYNNDKVNEALKAALQTSDSKVREDAYKQAQKLIWDDAPWVTLAVPQNLAGKKNYLDGIYLLPDGSLSVNDIEIKQ